MGKIPSEVKALINVSGIGADGMLGFLDMAEGDIWEWLNEKGNLVRVAQTFEKRQEKHEKESK